MVNYTSKGFSKRIVSGCLSDILIYLLYQTCENNYENFRAKKKNIISIFKKITKSNNQNDISLEKISEILKSGFKN